MIYPLPSDNVEVCYLCFKKELVDQLLYADYIHMSLPHPSSHFLQGCWFTYYYVILKASCVGAHTYWHTHTHVYTYTCTHTCILSIQAWSMQRNVQPPCVPPASSYGGPEIKPFKIALKVEFPLITSLIEAMQMMSPWLYNYWSCMPSSFALSLTRSTRKHSSTFVKPHKVYSYNCQL